MMLDGKSKFMKKETNKIQGSEPIFPEESGLIVEKILEKYGLAAEQNEGIEKFLKSNVPEDKREIFENLPGAKIAKLVRDYAEKKISLEDLPLLLEKELNVSEKDARQMANDLKKTILDFIRWEELEGKEMVQELPEELEEKEETITPEKPRISLKKDVYREPVD